MTAVLALLACSQPPLVTPESLAGGVPQEWIWLTSSDATGAPTDPAGAFEAAFPSLPTRYDTLETVVSAGEEGIRSRRYQSFVGKSAFVLYRTPEPAGAVASRGGPGPFAELVGKGFVTRIGAQVTDVRSWSGLGGAADGGWAARVKIGEAEGEVRIGVDGEVLYVLEVVGAPPEAAVAFLDAVRPIDEVRPVRVALPGGGEAECPSRCGPLAETLRVGAAGSPPSGRSPATVAVPLTGARGQLDQERYEVVSLPVGDLDPAAIVRALQARAVSHGSALQGETPIDGGVEVRFLARNGVGVSRIVERGGTVTAAEIVAPLGTLPAWGDRFLDSVR